MERNENELQKLYMVKHNFEIPLARDRGYEVEEVEMSFLEFKEIYRRNNIKEYYKALSESYSDNERYLLAYYMYSDTQAVSSEASKLFIDKVEKENYTEAVIFSNKDITDEFHKKFKGIPGVRVDFFQVNKATWNPTTHALASPAEKIEGEKLREVINSVTDDKKESYIGKLPRIMSDDPIVKYYGWDVGDIIIFTRTVQTDSIASSKFEYRVVS